jgi:RNA polymerase sigma-70 factor (ECF subfamily)
LEQLFVEHHRRVFQAAYRITGSATDAEDVLQTVFLRLLRREVAGGTGLSGTPGSYLHLAAVNGALDVVRARTASRSTPLDEGGLELAEAPRRGPEGRHEDGEIRESLRVALGRLSPRAAEMFVLRYLEGFTNREIARMLGRPQAVVAVTLHRARRRLREELRHFVGGRS